MKTIRTFLAVTVLVIVLVIALTSLTSVETVWALPPRPTEPAPVMGNVSGGALVLSLAWSNPTLPAQSIWTVVQWQAPSGAWYDVEGWQGTLDKAADGQGQKTWWVYHADLGKGPFRWLVYQKPGGALLATSAPFTLPAHDGVTQTVDLNLAP